MEKGSVLMKNGAHDEYLRREAKKILFVSYRSKQKKVKSSLIYVKESIYKKYQQIRYFRFAVIETKYGAEIRKSPTRNGYYFINNSRVLTDTQCYIMYFYFVNSHIQNIFFYNIKLHFNKSISKRIII